MEMLLELLLLGVLIGLSAVYSGSEIGFYSVSPVQVDLEVQNGRRRARLMQWLLRNESALLVTILVGNNLALELATHVAESLTGLWFGVRTSGPAAAVLVTLVLTPLVFVFGEALPKDVVRQRPYALTAMFVPLIALSRIVFWPLERALRLLTWALERVLRLESHAVTPLAGREAVAGFLAEGRRHGVLSARAEALASNALRLKTVAVVEAMVPWEDVRHLREDAGTEALSEAVLESKYSRLPVLAGGAGSSEDVQASDVTGYVHQLEVLHNRAVSDDPTSELDVFARVRPMLELEASESIDGALGKFRASGRRIGLVVREGEVLGLVSVNDVLDRISGVVVA